MYIPTHCPLCNKQLELTEGLDEYIFNCPFSKVYWHYTVTLKLKEVIEEFVFRLNYNQAGAVEDFYYVKNTCENNLNIFSFIAGKGNASYSNNLPLNKRIPPEQFKDFIRKIKLFV